MNLAERSLRSGAWSVAANGFKVVVLFGRAVILARLLPVETFGVYTLALSIVTLTGIFATFGLGGALVHRSAETEDENLAAATHFSLTLLLTAVWATVLIAGSLMLADGELQATLVALTLIYAGIFLTDTPRYILTRRVEHRRLALIDMAETMLATAAALALAWRGATVSALVATDAIALLVAVGGLYVLRPVWQPRLTLARESLHYFLRFGSRNVAAIALGAAIDRVDDIWTGAVLGPNALGFYSRAYTFATYPRRVLAYPINNVASGAMAELRDDRAALSLAFFRANALLVRLGFFTAGLLFLIAPEFVTVLLGDKWLPMVTPFRLLLIYALFDPVRATMSGLFAAAGHPEQLVWSRVAQLATLLAGLWLLGRLYGINGVAIAVDAMLIVGLVIQTVQAKAHVDFSVAQLFGVPAIALAAGMTLALLLAWQLCPPPTASAYCANPWISALLKSLAFAGPFIAVSMVLEGNEVAQLWRSARTLLARDQEATT